MTAQGSSITGLKGRDFLLKVDIAGTSPTTFTTLSGARMTSLKINGNQVDITNKGSSGWQELLSNAGVRHIEIGLSGVYDGVSTGVFPFFEKAALANTFIDAQIVFGNGVTYTGTWAIADYSAEGPHDNAQTYSGTLSSHGIVNRAGN